MLTLEQRRLNTLGLSVDKSRGLIIPIILRGAKHLPDEITRVRHCYDFESFQLGGRRLSRHPKFAPAIREMAGYICDRYHELSALPENVFQEYEQFSLPDENEIRPFLDVAAGFRMPFPRGESLCVPQTLWVKS